MTPDETLRVCRLAKALSPAQAVDEYQPEAWHLVLRSWRCEDALLAMEQLGGEQEWIHVSHIVGRIKRIRRDRVLEFGTLPNPPVGHDPDNVPMHTAWMLKIQGDIADGTLTRDEAPATTEALPARDVLRELGQAGTTPAEEDRADDMRRRARQAASDARRERQAATPPEHEPLLGPDDHSREPTTADAKGDCQ